MVCDEGLAPPLHQQGVRLTERNAFLQVRITVTHVYNQLGIKFIFMSKNRHQICSLWILMIQSLVILAY